MREVGIRELKEHASEIIREVQETKTSVAVTYRGKIVAQIVPIEDKKAYLERSREVWAEMDRLTEEIATLSPTGKSAVELVREQRRDL